MKTNNFKAGEIYKSNFTNLTLKVVENSPESEIYFKGEIIEDVDGTIYFPGRPNKNSSAIGYVGENWMKSNYSLVTVRRES